MYRRIVFQAKLNQPYPTNKGYGTHHLSEGHCEEAEDSANCMVDEQRQCTIETLGYSVENLSEDLSNKVSVHEEATPYPLQFLSTKAILSQEIIFQKTDKCGLAEKSKMLKKTKSSEQANKRNEFGEAILTNQAFRNSLANIILQKVEE